MPIDPIRLTADVRDGYVRYLTSSFRLRNDRLRQMFREEVDRFVFTNGPFLRGHAAVQRRLPLAGPRTGGTAEQGDGGVHL